MTIACFHDYLLKNQFLPIIFYTENDNFPISRACSLYDVIVTSLMDGTYFGISDKEDIHSYTLIVNLGLYDFQY